METLMPLYVFQASVISPRAVLPSSRLVKAKEQERRLTN